MELLIFSDSHGKHDGMQLAIDRQVTRVDAVVFLGDGLRDAERLLTDGATLFSVRGNCDWFADSDVESELTLNFEEHRLFLTHGHAYGVKGGIGALISHAADIGADIVLFGHTHAACERWERVPGEERLVYLCNPGSLSEPRDGAPSYGILTLQGKDALFSIGRL